MSKTEQNQVVVSGMRPTGPLHLGHYHGVIENWVRLQNDAKYTLYCFVADYHALTTEYENTAMIQQSTHDMVLDWLAFGVDPTRVVCFVQSDIPEHAELSLLLSMITPVGWLERVPSYKDLQRELTHRDLATYGFLGYPVLQTADVAMYDGTHVPVGQDQVAHIELSREIVRRFNHITNTTVLKEPQPLLTTVPKLPGTDGRKMSKSYGNSVYLSDTAAERQKKILPMMTDPARVRRTDAGDPEKCPVFDYHRIYSSAAVQDEVVAGCTQAKMGCVDCKKMLLTGMSAKLDPYVETRQALLQKPAFISDVIVSGAAQAKKKAEAKMQTVKAVMGL